MTETSRQHEEAGHIPLPGSWAIAERLLGRVPPGGVPQERDQRDVALPAARHLSIASSTGWNFKAVL